ncbi:GNAT family N-acetyltransferase (plasmid) [Azospirillum sp. A26]|uniref:GNAT family N-acetyltransferase n=1 Tax=Azospirillum sp. A26 TaxID=3160607 RepID=UPI00366BB0C7
MIRYATAGDIPAVEDLLRLMHAEIGMAPPDEEKARAVVARCFDRGTGAVLVACAEDGAIVGTLGMVFDQFWYTTAWHLQEMWTFVHPDHRRSTHAKDLLLNALETARKVKVPFVAAVFTDQRTEGKRRLFARYLPQVGAIFKGD